MSIVRGLSRTTHTLSEAGLFKHLPEFGGDVLTAPIGMNDQAGSRGIAPDELGQGPGDQVRRHH